MQFLRSLLTQGHLAIVPYKTLENHWQSLTLSSPPSPAPWLQLDQRQFFLSLVPTQLQRLLNQTGNGTDANPSAPPTLDVISWLRQFHTIFLGGAPAWPSLLHQARGYHLPLAPTYGMTETASQIVTMAPRDFLRGQTGCGEVLPHARVKIDDRPHSQSSPTAPTSPASPTSSTSDDDANGGKIIIAAKSLMLGYYQVDPAQVALLDMEVGTGEGERSFEPDDLGYFAPGGYLHIIGRQSHKIISGGENIFPAEVEAAIQRTGLVADVAVLGLPDPQWGEQVVAVYVVAKGTVTEVTVAEIKRELVSGLARYKWPKQWIAVDEIPRNAQGKINRQAIGDLALGYKTSGS
jgi:O-succinylbenzoic acid--CoA ligase